MPFRSEGPGAPRSWRSWGSAIFIAASLFLCLNWALDRVDENDYQTDRTCSVLAYILTVQGEGLSTIDYYKNNPDELEEALAFNRHALKVLNCVPIEPQILDGQ